MIKYYCIVKESEITRAMIDEGKSSVDAFNDPVEIVDDNGNGTEWYVVTTFDKYATSLHAFRKMSYELYLTERTKILNKEKPNNKNQMLVTVTNSVNSTEYYATISWSELPDLEKEGV